MSALGWYCVPVSCSSYPQHHSATLRHPRRGCLHITPQISQISQKVLGNLGNLRGTPQSYAQAKLRALASQGAEDRESLPRQRLPGMRRLSRRAPYTTAYAGSRRFQQSVSVYEPGDWTPPILRPSNSQKAATSPRRTVQFKPASSGYIVTV